MKGNFIRCTIWPATRVWLHVDKTTQLKGAFKAGDNVDRPSDRLGARLIMTVNVAGIGGPQLFIGDLLKIEGEFYTVHDTAGHEVRLM